MLFVHVASRPFSGPNRVRPNAHILETHGAKQVRAQCSHLGELFQRVRWRCMDWVSR